MKFHPYRRRGWLPIVSLIATIILAIVLWDWLVLVIGLAISLLLLVLCIRPFCELVSMPWLRKYFRMSTVGANHLPKRGGVLVIANHASHFDPPVICHELARPMIGAMTSDFYDRWYFKWAAKYIFRIIRVPAKREGDAMPDLDEIVTRLDRGECVLVFPEGWLRRKDDVPLRRFGQGIWRVLQMRPQTPVLPCWIEGMWGSYYSHHDGPPTVNKAKDRGRPIQLIVGQPVVVPEETLSDGMMTRLMLMSRVLELKPA